MLYFRNNYIFPPANPILIRTRHIILFAGHTPFTIIIGAIASYGISLERKRDCRDFRQWDEWLSLPQFTLQCSSSGILPFWMNDQLSSNKRSTPFRNIPSALQPIADLDSGFYGCLLHHHHHHHHPSWVEIPSSSQDAPYLPTSPFTASII